MQFVIKYLLLIQRLKQVATVQCPPQRNTTLTMICRIECINVLNASRLGRQFGGLYKIGGVHGKSLVCTLRTVVYDTKNTVYRGFSVPARAPGDGTDTLPDQKMSSVGGIPHGRTRIGSPLSLHCTRKFVARAIIENGATVQAGSTVTVGLSKMCLIALAVRSLCLNLLFH